MSDFLQKQFHFPKLAKGGVFPHGEIPLLPDTHETIIPLPAVERCPFCGCRAEETAKEKDGDSLHGVRCKNVWCIGFDIKPQYFSAADAREAWNRRAADGN